MIGGVDEAGRGPVIGPLVIAGITASNQSVLQDIGAKDSKKLTPKQRELLAQQIQTIADDIEIIIITAADIDDMRKVMTLNEIEVHGFTKVIKKLKPEICYVDAADVNDRRFGNNIEQYLSKKTNIISKHKADDIYPIVGAASIIAKTKRDQEVKRIEAQLTKKLALPLGSGYPADPITQKFLQAWVKEYGKLPPHTRQSWKTAQTILRSVKTRTLDDFR
jgi:ribonuclease HII